MDDWAYAVVHNLLRKGNVGTTVIGPLSLVIGQGPGTGNGEQKTRQRRAGSWLVARRSRLDARGFLDSRGEGTAKMADGGQRPGTGIRTSSLVARRSWLVARRSWVVACASRSWRAAAFACSRRKVCQSAAGTIESSHAARARGKRCPHASFFRLEPRRGE